MSFSTFFSSTEKFTFHLDPWVVKVDFPAEWDSSSCTHTAMWFLVPKWDCRGRYNTIVSLLVPEDWKGCRITSLNSSTRKLHFAHKPFQATFQVLIITSRISQTQSPQLIQGLRNRLSSLEFQKTSFSLFSNFLLYGKVLFFTLCLGFLKHITYRENTS